MLTCRIFLGLATMSSSVVGLLMRNTDPLHFCVAVSLPTYQRNHNRKNAYPQNFTNGIEAGLKHISTNGFLRSLGVDLLERNLESRLVSVKASRVFNLQGTVAQCAPYRASAACVSNGPKEWYLACRRLRNHHRLIR